MNLVTTKAGAEHELLFYKPASAIEAGLLSIEIRLEQDNTA